LGKIRVESRLSWWTCRIKGDKFSWNADTSMINLVNTQVKLDIFGWNVRIQSESVDLV